jgi:2-haloalkanoic acid dehalogenase type II
MGQPSLTAFRVLSFDCYGTLIDWESGIFKQLRPLLDRLPEHHPLRAQTAVLEYFNKQQIEIQQNQPKTLYSRILSICYERIAEQGGVSISNEEAIVFGQSAGQWEAFPDTVMALRKLQKHYKLIILSNVDNVNIKDTVAGPLHGVNFDAVLTAEDIGSYKPSHKNFQALLLTIHEHFNIDKKDLLHVAKSLPIDHVTTKEMGITSAWIARGEGGITAMGGRLDDFNDKVAPKWSFESLGHMASMVERDFAGGK